jgi:DNA replication protein DnaC
MIMNCGMPDASRYIKSLKPLSSNEVVAYKKLQVVKDNIVEYVKNGRDLFITSDNIQTGKTSWAIKIMYRFFDRIWSGNGFRCRGFFVYMPDFVLNLKSMNYKETSEYKEICKNLETADLVIWDDITFSRLSEYEQSILYPLFNKRSMSDNKLNIYTGINSADITALLGYGIASKILNAEKIVFDGPSRIKGEIPKEWESLG